MIIAISSSIRASDSDKKSEQINDITVALILRDVGRYIAWHLYSVWCSAKMCLCVRGGGGDDGGEWNKCSAMSEHFMLVQSETVGWMECRYRAAKEWQQNVMALYEWFRIYSVCVYVLCISVDWYSAASLPSHGTEKYKQNYFGCIVFFLDVWQGLFFIYFIVYMHVYFFAFTSSRRCLAAQFLADLSISILFQYF